MKKPSEDRVKDIITKAVSIEQVREVCVLCVGNAQESSRSKLKVIASKTEVCFTYVGVLDRGFACGSHWDER